MSWFHNPVLSWVPKLLSRADGGGSLTTALLWACCSIPPTPQQAPPAHTLLTSCSSTSPSQRTGGGKGEGEFLQQHLLAPSSTYACLTWLQVGQRVRSAIVQGGEGLYISQGTSTSARKQNCLNPSALNTSITQQDCFASVFPKETGQTLSAATCFTFIYFCLQVCIFFQPHHISTASLHYPPLHASAVPRFSS